MSHFIHDLQRREYKSNGTDICFRRDRGFIEGQTQDKLTGCEVTLPAWFDHVRKSVS